MTHLRPQVSLSPDPDTASIRLFSDQSIGVAVLIPASESITDDNIQGDEQKLITTDHSAVDAVSYPSHLAG